MAGIFDLSLAQYSVWNKCSSETEKERETDRRLAGDEREGTVSGLTIRRRRKREKYF